MSDGGVPSVPDGGAGAAASQPVRAAASQPAGAAASQPASTARPAPSTQPKLAEESVSPIDLNQTSYGTIVPEFWRKQADASPVDKTKLRETLTKIYSNNLRYMYLKGRYAMAWVVTSSGTKELFLDLKDFRWKALSTLYEKTENSFKNKQINGANLADRLKKYIEARVKELRKKSGLSDDYKKWLEAYDRGENLFALAARLLALDLHAVDEAVPKILEILNLIKAPEGKKFGKLSFSVKEFDGIYTQLCTNLEIVKPDGNTLVLSAMLLGEKAAKDEPFIKLFGGILSQNGITENDSLEQIEKYLGKGNPVINKAHLNQLSHVSAGNQKSSALKMRVYVIEKSNLKANRVELYFVITQGGRILMETDKIPPLEKMDPRLRTLAENLVKAGTRGKNLIELIFNYQNSKGEEAEKEEGEDDKKSERGSHIATFSDMIGNLIGGVEDEAKLFRAAQAIFDAVKADSKVRRSDILKFLSVMLRFFFSDNPRKKISLANILEVIGIIRKAIAKETVTPEKIKTYYVILGKQNKPLTEKEKNRWQQAKSYYNEFQIDFSKPAPNSEQFSPNELIGAANLADFGTEGRKATEDAQTVQKQLEDAQRECKFQKQFEERFVVEKAAVIQINEALMAEVAAKAARKSLKETPLLRVLQSLSIFKLSERKKIKADPFKILLEYIKLISGRLASLPPGFLTRYENGKTIPGALELFAEGRRPLSSDEMQTFLGIIELIRNKGFDKELLYQAIKNVQDRKEGDAMLPVWSKFLLGEKGIRVLADPKLTTLRAPFSKPAEVEGKQEVAPRTEGLVAESYDVSFENLPKEAPLVNLWLLAINQYPTEISAAEMAQALEHRAALGYLTATTLNILLKVFDEKFLINRPLPQSLQKLLREILAVELKGPDKDKKDQIKLPGGFKLSKKERALLRRILAYSENPGKIQLGILNTEDKSLLAGIFKKLFALAGSLGKEDKNHGKAVRLRDYFGSLELRRLSKEFKDKPALKDFIQHLERGRFRTKEGVVIDRVYSLDLDKIPKELENTEIYRKGIEILRNLADGLREGTVYEEEVPTQFFSKIWHGVRKGMKESLATQDASILNGVEDGTIQYYKYLFFYGEAHFQAQVSAWDNELKGLLVELEAIYKAGKMHIKNRDKIKKDFERMKPLAAKIRELKEKIRKYSENNNNDLKRNTNMGVRAKFNTLLALAWQAETWLLDIEKGIAFIKFMDEKLGKDKDVKAKQEEFIQACYNTDPKEPGEKKKREDYLKFIEAFDKRHARIDDEIDRYDTEANNTQIGGSYLNSEDLDGKFLQAFIEHFAKGRGTGDFGAFELNFDLLPKIFKTKMTLKDENGNEIKTGRALFAFILRTFKKDSHYWTSLSKDPTDDFLTTRRAKQAFVLILQFMPLRRIKYDPLKTGMNVAGHVGQHFIGRSALGRTPIRHLFNPISFGLISYYLDKVGINMRRQVGGPSLQELEAVVNSPTERMAYQAAETLGSISVPRAMQTVNISRNARILFDQNLNTYSETDLYTVGWQTVDAAAHQLSVYYHGITTVPEHVKKYDELLKKSKILIDIPGNYAQIRSALLALAKYLKESMDMKGKPLRIEVLGTAQGAYFKADEVLKDAPAEVKLGLIYLSQLTMEAPLIMAEALKDPNEKTEGLASTSITNPKTIMKDRLQVKVEGEKVTVVRDTATGASPYTVTYKRGSEEPLKIYRDRAQFDPHEAFVEGFLEGGTFALKIPVDIFSGFVNDVVEAAEWVQAVIQQAANSKDPVLKKLYEEKARILARQLRENLTNTYGSFLSFELNPVVMLMQLKYYAQHREYDKFFGYALIAVPFALQVLYKDIVILRNFARIAIGDGHMITGPHGQPLRWNSYGMASFPVVYTQKLHAWLDKKIAKLIEWKWPHLKDRRRNATRGVSRKLDAAEAWAKKPGAAVRFRPTVRALSMPAHVMQFKFKATAADVEFLLRYFKNKVALGNFFLEEYTRALSEKGYSPPEIREAIRFAKENGAVEFFRSGNYLKGVFQNFESYLEAGRNRIIARELGLPEGTPLNQEQLLEAMKNKRVASQFKAFSKTAWEQYMEGICEHVRGSARYAAGVYHDKQVEIRGANAKPRTAREFLKDKYDPVLEKYRARISELEKKGKLFYHRQESIELAEKKALFKALTEYYDMAKNGKIKPNRILLPEEFTRYYKGVKVFEKAAGTVGVILIIQHIAHSENKAEAIVKTGVSLGVFIGAFKAADKGVRSVTKHPVWRFIGDTLVAAGITLGIDEALKAWVYPSLGINPDSPYWNAGIDSVVGALDVVGGGAVFDLMDALFSHDEDERAYLEQSVPSIDVTKRTYLNTVMDWNEKINAQIAHFKKELQYWREQEPLNPGRGTVSSMIEKAEREIKKLEFKLIDDNWDKRQAFQLAYRVGKLGLKRDLMIAEVQASKLSDTDKQILIDALYYSFGAFNSPFVMPHREEKTKTAAKKMGEDFEKRFKALYGDYKTVHKDLAFFRRVRPPVYQNWQDPSFWQREMQQLIARLVRE